jgi:hypothetical protein
VAVRVSKEVRRTVAERAGLRCEYCRCLSEFTSDDYAVEHIHPQARGGNNALANLAWSCPGCNSRKFTATTGIDPVTGDTVALYHPRRDRWGDHFAWAGGGLFIAGVSPTGRATVERIRLNRRRVVNLRYALITSEVHPPADEPAIDTAAEDIPIQPD